MYPPLHIEVNNNDHHGRKAIAKKEKQFNNNNHILHVDKIAMADRQSSVTSTEKSVNSAVTILSIFAENNSVPLYRYIGAVFLLILALCLMGNMLIYMKPSLSWDGASKEGNPIS